MAASTFLRRLVIPVTFGASGVTDYTLIRDDSFVTPSNLTYNSIEINQGFTGYTIDNKSDFQGAFSLEKDIADAKTISLTPAQEVKQFEPFETFGSSVSEDRINEFYRIRIFLNGAGQVDLELVWEAPVI